MRQILTVFFLALMLQGCSMSAVLPKNKLRSVTVQAAPDANNTMPTALDIVFVSEAPLADTLAGLSGPEWFRQKKQLNRKFAGAIHVRSVQVVPFSSARRVKFPKGTRDARKVLLFVNYLSADGQYVSELGSYKHLKITLNRDDYDLGET